MRWCPAKGHVPRGFCGATGKRSEVKLVLVCAEPGNPHEGETYPNRCSPLSLFNQACSHAYGCLESGMEKKSDTFHKKLRHILDLCFPGQEFMEQMRQVWITDSVLCSARDEGNAVPQSAERECCSRFLKPVLQLFPQAVVAALGRKASRRMDSIDRVLVHASAAAPPGCFRRGAKASWQRIADQVHKAFPDTRGISVPCHQESLALQEGAVPRSYKERLATARVVRALQSLPCTEAIAGIGSSCLNAEKEQREAKNPSLLSPPNTPKNLQTNYRIADGGLISAS